MLQLSKLPSLARHTLSFALHFAHGGLVMAGVLVVGLIGYQVSQYGPEGLNPKMVLGIQESAASDAGLVAEEKQEVVAEAMPEEPEVGLSPALNRVAKMIARRHKVSPLVVESLVQAAQREGRANGIDPLLILAVVTVESGFNPYAQSVVGAQGLMQIIPKFHQEKISTDMGKIALFDPTENIRVGAKILKEYLNLTGSIEGALQTYGGASDDPQRAYSNRVKTELQRLKQVAGPARERTTTAHGGGQTSSLL